MKTRNKRNTPVKLLSTLLLSVALAVPMVVEAGRDHHHHHHDHHDYHGHYGHHDHHDSHDHHYYDPGPGYSGYGRPHHHHNHYITRNIYYNQPYYPPVYGVAPGNFFLGISTGDAGFMLGY